MNVNVETSSALALHLWDYFYLSNCPSTGEARAWRRIERATGRIRESEPYFRGHYPAVVRFRNAKRVRRAAREIVRHVPELDTVPAQWVAEAIEFFERLAEVVIETTRDAARELPPH